MKKLWFFLLLCSAAFGQTSSITAHLQDPSTGVVGSRTFVRFELKNTGGNQCRVGGTALITPYIKDFAPNSSGLVSGTIYKNSSITCGSQTGNTQWAFTIWRDGKPQPSCFTQITTSSVNLDSQACSNTTPVVSPPTGDTTYCRVDGSNCGFTGNVTLNSNNLTGAATVTAAKFNNRVFLDGTKYALTAAGIQAAHDSADCPSAGCYIDIGPNSFNLTAAVAFTKPVCLVGAGVNVTILTYTPATGTAFSYSPVNLGACFEHLTITTSTSTTSVGVQFNYVNEGMIFDAKIHGFFGGIRITGDGSANYSSGIRIDQVLVDFNCGSGSYNLSLDHVNDTFLDAFRFYQTGGGLGNCTTSNGLIVDRGVGGFWLRDGTIEGGLHSSIIQNTSLGGAYGAAPAAIFSTGVTYDNAAGGTNLLFDSSLGTAVTRFFGNTNWFAFAGNVAAPVTTAMGFDIEGGTDIHLEGAVCRGNESWCGKINSSGKNFSIDYVSILDNNQGNTAGVGGILVTANPSQWRVSNSPFCGNGEEAGGHMAYCVDYSASVNGTGSAFGNTTVALGTAPYNIGSSVLAPLTASQFMVNDTFPAASGAIRLAEANNGIKSKNHAVGGDVIMVQKDTATDVVQLGDTAGVRISGPLAMPGSTAALTADWTCGTSGTVASCVAATIIGSGGGVPLTFTLPLTAQSYTLECDGVVGQATAATANNWNLLTATNGATNVTTFFDMFTAAGTKAAGATTDQASTTTTFNIGGTWTLGGTGTKMPFHIWAKIEGASASGTVVSLQLVAPTVGDLVTIYRGTSCRLY